MSTVAETGEFALIARLAKHLPAYRPDVMEGIGDDVAVVRLGNGRLLLLTCDIQVAGIHFKPEAITPYQLGRKVAAINLSDIGAAGGEPRHFLISLGLPPETEVENLEALYDGLRDECLPLGVDVAGGNISRLPTLAIDAFLTGEVSEEQLLLRKGAQPGDLVLVTGALGASRAGLELVLHPDLKEKVTGRAIDGALAAHLTPTPRVAAGRAIAAAGGASAMLDISDGLAADVGHLCDQSGTDVCLWAGAIPVATPVAPIAAVAGGDPLVWALTGGEDYELCFTASPSAVDRLVAAVREATGTPVTVVGEIAPSGAGRLLRLPDGAERSLGHGGWDHFAQR